MAGLLDTHIKLDSKSKIVEYGTDGEFKGVECCIGSNVV